VHRCLVETTRVGRYIRDDEAERVRGWLVAVEELLGNLLSRRLRRPLVKPAVRLLMAVQALEDLQEDRPEPHLIALTSRVAATVKRRPPASSGVEAMVVLVDSLSRAVASACRGGKPLRLRYASGFHSLPPSPRLKVTAAASLLHLLQQEVSMENVGQVRAEAFCELAKLAPARTSALALTASELAWLREFVELAAEGRIQVLHDTMAARLSIEKSTSQKIARRLRAKEMLPPLLPNGKPDWQPTPRAIRTVAGSSSAPSPTSGAS